MKRFKLFFIGMSFMLVFATGCKKQEQAIIPETPTEVENQINDQVVQIEEEDKEDEKETEDEKDIADEKGEEVEKEESKVPTKEPVKKPAKDPIKVPVKEPEKDKEPVKVPEVVEPPVLSETNIDKAHLAIKNLLGESYTPSMEMSSEQLAGIIGFSLDQLLGHIAETPMISMQVDTFIGIGATKDNVKAVEAALKEYRRTIVEETLQYPMNLAKVQASKVIRINNDVYFIMLGAYDDRGEVTEEQALEFARSEVSKIEEVIKNSY